MEKIIARAVDGVFGGVREERGKRGFGRWKAGTASPFPPRPVVCLAWAVVGRKTGRQSRFCAVESVIYETNLGGGFVFSKNCRDLVGPPDQFSGNYGCHLAAQKLAALKGRISAL